MCPSEHLSTVSGTTLHFWMQTLLAHGTTLLRSTWHWTIKQCQLLHSQLCMVVAPCPWAARQVSATPFILDSFQWTHPAAPYPASLCTFLHALRVGAHDMRPLISSPVSPTATS